VTGPANHDFIIALDGSSANGPLSFRVAALPAAGKLYQYAAGQRGPAISVPGTGGADGDGQVIFAPFANGFGNPYSAFSFLANDGEADSLPASVTINILPPGSPIISSFLRNSNGVFQLAFAGDSNTTYCVWASTNLANWEYLGLAAQATPGTFQFQDLSVGTSPQRFYRISTGCGTPVPRLSGNSAKIPGGAFALSFTGGPYWSYRVWASTNLVNWELLGPATETAPGVFRFSDSSATNWPLRFYKAGAP
jgi:hypothetical protein